MKKILILDDDKACSLILQTYLNYKEDWSVDMAQNAKDAFSALEEAEYDVVISDLYMPDISGLEFLSRVSNKYPPIIRVLFSANISKLGEKPSYINFICEKGKFSIKELADKISLLLEP